MGRGTTSGGVELRDNSIRVVFSYQGKQRKETLYLDNSPLLPTPANVKYARRIATEIKEKIRAGTFDFATYFPQSKNAPPQESKETKNLHELMDLWLQVMECKASTKDQYRSRINSFWKVKLSDRPITAVKYPDLALVLSNGTWSSGKSRNNEIGMMKRFFTFCVKSGYLSENPAEGLEKGNVQKKKPDPFATEEVGLILDHLKANHPPQIHNYVEFLFFTGLRTSEAIALQWTDIDFRKKEMLIERAMVYEDESDSTKTSKARTVRLTSRALEALDRQKLHSYLQGKHVFLDPRSGEPWDYTRITDSRVFWGTTLKKLGIRHRRQYNTRHTYATLGLHAGAKPGFMANQLGHSLEMFFNVYADWINSEDDDKEMAKIEAAITQIIPELSLRSPKLVAANL